MNNNTKMILAIIGCILLTIGIYFEVRVLLKDINKIYDDRTAAVISLATTKGKTNVSIAPSIHIYEEVPFEEFKDGGVVEVVGEHVQLSGRASKIQDDSKEEINYVAMDGSSHKLYYHIDYGAEVDTAIDSYFNHDMQLLLELLPESRRPSPGSVMEFQQTFNLSVIPVLYFPHVIKVSDNTVEKMFYYMFIPTDGGALIMYSDLPFIITEKPVTGIIGKVTDNPMTEHVLSMYEAGAIDNTRLQMGAGELEDYTFNDVIYPVYGNFDGPTEQHQRKELLDNQMHVFSLDGYAEDGVTKIDTQSAAAQTAQISVRKDETTNFYLSDANLKIESITFNNAVDNSSYTATITLGNTVSEAHGFVVGVYALDDDRGFLGMKVFDHTADPIPADGQITVECTIDSTVVKDPTIVHYLQFDLR